MFLKKLKNFSSAIKPQINSMRVTILGAGIIGVTTAWELLKTGHEVSIIDRQKAPALETSFGNAGLIAPGHSYAWTTPKLPGNLLKSIFKRQQAFRFKWQWDPNMWCWGLQFLLQCRRSKMKENTLRKHTLSVYSQKLFQKLTNELEIDYHQNRKGLIYIFRTPESFLEGKAKMEILMDNMENLQLLSTEELLAKEPSLKNMESPPAGGIYCPTDESGCCHDFTTALAALCEKKGVRFHYNTKVESFQCNERKLKVINTDKREFETDVCVMALAAYSPLMAKKAGDYLPIYPVKGNSLTVPILDTEKAPDHSGIDEDNLLAFSMMGDKIRFTSVAEISGYDTSCTPADFTAMTQQAESLFPGAMNFSHPEYWAGLRPMTPNGAPIFGRGKLENLFYNTGHGHLGWTMCAGSAKITADIINNQAPEISLAGMTISTA